MKRKNIFICVLLSIITGVIYNMVWIVKMTNTVAYFNDDEEFNGGTYLLLIILTLGIYNWVWSYKMGKEIYDAQIKKGIASKDRSGLYLAFSILPFNLINYCIMQSDLNKLIDVQN